MARAFYHQSTGRSIELDVLKTHKDGTVDLGREDKVMVARCTVSDEVKVGHATLQKKEKASAPQGEKKPTKAELKTAAKEAADALDQARKSLDDDPDNEDLKARVAEIESSLAAIEEAAK